MCVVARLQQMFDNYLTNKAHLIQKIKPALTNFYVIHNLIVLSNNIPRT